MYIHTTNISLLLIYETILVKFISLYLMNLLYECQSQLANRSNFKKKEARFIYLAIHLSSLADCRPQANIIELKISIIHVF